MTNRIDLIRYCRYRQRRKARKERNIPLNRLLPIISILIVALMGCAPIERLGQVRGRDAAPKPLKPIIEIGMSGLSVVKIIGFPVNGTTLADCDGVKRDIWVYDEGHLVLMFENGKISSIVGPGGERPSIRLYR